MFDDDAPAAKPVRHTLGADLSRLSVADLSALVAALEEEAARVRAAIAAKQATQAAADALFRR
ncbi:DUF1192 family protein [Pseudoxanthobacter sp.]|uniref:DUF1192 family protein n=1 Tax=Pseudoxanthobacter sp. TaxID=1925742 RepID=UPI002FE16AA8